MRPRRPVSSLPRSVRGLAVAAALALASPAAAHEIPRDVTVRAFVRPEGNLLRLAVRVPLEAFRDLEIPTRGAGLLDLARAGPVIRDGAARWVGDYVRFREEGRPIPAGRLVVVRVSLPSDRSFGTFGAAVAHLRGPPLPDATELPWRQAVVDMLFEYPIASDRSRFAVEAEWAHLGLRTWTVLWFEPPGRPARAFQFTGDPGLVRLDPRWHQAALRFVALGFGHILDGLDHLLFLLCLVLPVRRVRPLVAVVTAFTAAHSITLVASALGLVPGALWFPPLIETLIALSIVFMAIENLVGARPGRRWALAFAFGLVHGFGFSFALRETLQFAGGHLLTSLLAFNLGVELGQLAVVAAAVPLLGLLFRRAVPERVGVAVISVLVGHTAWHWMAARWGDLTAFEWRWPAWGPALAAGLLRTLMLVLIAGGAAWLLSRVFGRWLRSTEPARVPAPAPAADG